MASSSIQYNPVPPRVWSRVQNPCSSDIYNSSTNYAKADYERQMLLKGNILQYKKNSSNLTKKQRYTQIAKGMWTNRTKTWATQSDTYTNPNMTSLLRVNSAILDPSNNVFSNRSNPFGCQITSIQDGGNLVCNVTVNPCTQEVIKRTQSQQICNPTTASDVPGQIQDLCWNDGTQTWYPRQRYVMPTSGSKWPEGYKGFVSALTFVGPVLSVGTITCNQLDIPLSWTFLDSTCAPITSFNIYQNGVLILNVPVSQTSIIINETVSGTTMFYVTSLSNGIESKKSNMVIVSTENNYTIGNDSSSPNVIISNNGKTITFIANGSITFFCDDINIDVICVGGGGGGGGGSYAGGGGGGAGGGGQISTTLLVSTITTYFVTVGNGGIPGSKGTVSDNGVNGSNGESSSITGIITSIGGNGGYGGTNYYANGGNGGDAGGTVGTGGIGGTASNTGGTGFNGGGGGGGGYSGSTGGSGSINGGDGYGSGGGGGGGNSGSGGFGGINAGNGSQGDSEGTPGKPNKGGGGGGGKSGNGDNSKNLTSWGGGQGGSGVVILTIL